MKFRASSLPNSEFMTNVPQGFFPKVFPAPNAHLLFQNFRGPKWYPPPKKKYIYIHKINSFQENHQTPNFSPNPQKAGSPVPSGPLVLGVVDGLREVALRQVHLQQVLQGLHLAVLVLVRMDLMEIWLVDLR